MPRVFYGWFVAVGCGVVSFAVVGVGFYGLVVLLDALVSERGWSRDEVSGVTTLYWVMVGVVGLAIGRGVDRLGARGFITAGVTLMAMALYWMGRIESSWQIVPVYLLLALGFAMAGAIPNGAIVTRWFVGRRARAMTISHTGVSLGGMLLVPIVSGWIDAEGFRVALDRMAIGLVGLALPIVVFVLRFDPEDHGLEPDGGDLRRPLAAALRPAVQQRVWSRREILRSPAFRTLAAAYALMLLCQVGYSMHQLSFLREGLDLKTASLGVSLVALGSLLARLVLGPLADRMSKRHLASALFGFQAVMIVVLANAESAPALLAASLCFGFTVGMIFLLQTLLVGEIFGLVSFATAMGLQQVVSQVTSGFGPLVLGLLASAYGGYSPALYWLAGGAAVAAGLVLLTPPGGASEGAISR